MIHGQIKIKLLLSLIIKATHIYIICILKKKELKIYKVFQLVAMDYMTSLKEKA